MAKIAHELNFRTNSIFKSLTIFTYFKKKKKSLISNLPKIITDNFYIF